MRTAILLIIVLVGTFATGSSAPGAAHAQQTPQLFLPLVTLPQRTYAPLPPEQLGEPLPVATATAFFSDQIFSADGDLAIWIPPGVTTVRGIFLRNGSPVRPNPADPAWRNEVAQNRELAARQLASAWGFAYVSGALWDDARRGYSDQKAYWEASLQAFAVQTNRPELLTAPLAVIGESRNASFGNRYAQDHPERVIGYVIVVADSAGVAPGVPGLILVGERDRGAQIVAGSFTRDRRAGGLIAIAVIWGKGHVCDRCGDLAWPFLDALVRLRLPAAEPSAGRPELLPLTEADGFLGNTATWDAIAPYATYTGDKGAAAWLPTPALAQAWYGFVQRAPAAQLTAPTQPYSWSNGFTQEPAPLFKRQPQPIAAGRSFNVAASLNRAPAGSLDLAVNGRIVGPLAYNPATQRYTRELSLPAGVHQFAVLENGAPISWPAGLVVVPE